MAHNRNNYKNTLWGFALFASLLINLYLLFTRPKFSVNLHLPGMDATRFYSRDHGFFVQLDEEDEDWEEEAEIYETKEEMNVQVRQFAYAPIECNYMVVDGDGAVYVSIAKPEFIDGLQEWTSETRLYLIGQTIGPPDPDWDTKIHEFEKSTKI